VSGCEGAEVKVDVNVEIGVVDGVGTVGFDF
jgi:hypothetical protein